MSGMTKSSKPRSFRLRRQDDVCCHAPVTRRFFLLAVRRDETQTIVERGSSSIWALWQDSVDFRVEVSVFYSSLPTVPVSSYSLVLL